MSANAPDGIVVLGTFGGREILTTYPSVNPSAGAGLQKPLGSVYLEDNGTLWSKTGAGATQWSTVNFSGTGAGITGDGSDGNVTLGAGTTTLTRDMFYNNLTVPVGSVLAPDGYRVFVLNTLTLDGVIDRSGAAGASVGNPAAGGAAVSASGRPLQGQSGGGNGNAGAGTAGTSVNPTAPGYTASAGAGGAGTNAAGAGGTSTPLGVGLGGLRMVMWAIEGRASGTSSQLGSTPSGGGGGGTFGGAPNGAIGGGGGAAGGYLVVVAGQITGAGVIRSNGGDGGNGRAEGAGNGAGGGGGGGNGGIVVVYSGNGVFPTVTADGGAAGAPSGTGGAGNPGAAGQVLLFSGAT